MHRKAKEAPKSHHDQDIKKKQFKNGDLVPIYDSKTECKMRKLEITRIGTYTVSVIVANFLVELETPIPLLRATLFSSSLHSILSQNQIVPQRVENGFFRVKRELNFV